MTDSSFSTSDLLLSGAFAKICGIPKSALHYYVSLGLLHPVYISSTNYKYYSTQQTYTIHLIQILQKAGCSLDEIQNYLTHKQQLSDYLKLLEEKEQKLMQARNELDHTISMLQTIHYFTDYSLNDRYTTPSPHYVNRSLTIFLTPLDTPVIAGTRAYAHAFTTHLKHCETCPDIMKYPIGYVMTEHDFLFEEYQYSAFFSISNNPFTESDTYTRLEKGQYIFYVYKGLPSQKQDAYSILLRYIENHSFTIISDIYELNLTNTIPLADESANTVLMMVQIC